MSKLANKRFSVTLGLSVAPGNTKHLFSFMNYGKLTYEDMVTVQNICDNYAESFMEWSKPLREELKELGIQQAAAVAEEREQEDNPAKAPNEKKSGVISNR